MRRDPEALLRARGRRDRDDQARRLREVIPSLATLTFQIDELPVGAPEPKLVSHVKHIIVDRAPARFELPCCDHKCDGSHDITRSVLAALKHHKTSFTGRDTCAGHGKEGACSFELRFTARATYSS